MANKSLIGFMGEYGSDMIDWMFLFLVTEFAIVGVFIGMALSKTVDGDRLKPAFGWFVLLRGI